MIRVGNLRTYERLPPVRKVLTLVFALVGKDRAAELRFDYRPDPPDARMSYCVAGVPQEMVPPPSHLWPEVFRVLWRETCFDSPDRPSWWQRLGRRPTFPVNPAAGSLTVHFGNVPMDFDILFFRGRTGQHILLQPTGVPDVSECVTEFFSRCIRKRDEQDGMIEL
jgi:hypothetical protein